MNCSVDYEKDDERKTTLHTKSLSEREQIPSQTPQECVEGSMKSHLGKPSTMCTSTHLGKDRPIRVSRIRKRSEPSVHKKQGRE
jgi:hypothetical protein